ncbi:MAG: trypsin-like serine protease, partial [Myxococcota bacterium]
ESGPMLDADRGLVRLAAGIALVGLLAGAFAIAAIPGETPEAPDPQALPSAAMRRLVRATPEGERLACSAFAVREELLATTADCVLRLEEARGRGEAVRALGVEGAAPLRRLWRHPAYDPATGSADVGLVELEGPAATSVVRLATPERLATLGGGAALRALGFALDASRPEPAPLALVGAEGQELLHGEAAADGAAVLDAGGAVVGLHAVAGAAPFGTGKVMRADLVLALLSGLGR